MRQDATLTARLVAASLLLPAGLAGVPAPGHAQAPPSAEVLLNDLACGGCHAGIPTPTDINDKAPDLSEAGLRFSPDHVLNFVQYPIKIRRQIGFSRMPNFHLDEREALALTLYLQTLVPAGTDRPDQVGQAAYRQAESRYPDVTAELGEDIFRALNCVACHRQASFVPFEDDMAPPLGFEGARVPREWLARFLREPQAVRSHGFIPGSGSRHPDFNLSASEVETLTDYLIAQREGPAALDVRFQPDTLSPFAMRKAETLLENRLPCLGCHRLGDEGGRIGPDLSSLKTRLQPDFVYQIVRDPQAVVPGIVMPKVEMPPATLNLIVDYLLQQEKPRSDAAYSSLVDNPPRFYQDRERPESQYVKYCAACHGMDGNGDGYNARYLPVQPTQHADSSYMAGRPDDTLFDGVFAGGYILNKSARMPPWGFTLPRDDIRGLVAYLRELCGCEGPAWSRDNR